MNSVYFVYFGYKQLYGQLQELKCEGFKYQASEG